jgi:MoxR-like ATPase
MATKTRPRKLTVQEKFMRTRKEIAEGLVEREEEIDVVLTALICQENPLLVGPPGTAKSLLLDSVVRWLGGGAKSFSLLLNKFSVPEEVFGPYSIKGLKSDRFQRVTTNRLPEADVAFLDEIFKASSAILNTTLKILNERKFENGDGTYRDCPLKICVSASNEWPDGQELGALFDRFLFRKTVRPVSKSGRKRLLQDNDLEPHLTTSISPDELEKAFDEASCLQLTADAWDALSRILDELNTEGIFPGDRRQRKSVMAAKAYAYLCGAEEVEPEHLEILAHVLWEDPTEQPKKTGQIVARIANPIAHAINEKLAQVTDVLKKNKATDAVPKLQQIQKELKQMADHPRKEMALAIVSKEIKSAYSKVIGADV